MSTTSTLGALAAANPAATRVFLRHRLDFCCGGDRTLDEACREANLDTGVIAAEIADESARRDDTASWANASLSAIADHIQGHYHSALRRDVPPLIAAAERVERVHAAKPDVPAGLADHLESFWRTMQIHMQKEEVILFPLIRRGARGEAVYMPVRAMEHEHDEHGHSLARIRELTGDLELPPHACGTWTALYHGLAALEEELTQHIHLENKVLFLRAVQSD